MQTHATQWKWTIYYQNKVKLHISIFCVITVHLDIFTIILISHTSESKIKMEANICFTST